VPCWDRPDDEQGARQFNYCFDVFAVGIARGKAARCAGTEASILSPSWRRPAVSRPDSVRLEVASWALSVLFDALMRERRLRLLLRHDRREGKCDDECDEKARE
jgi:hypothetical protein